MIAFSLSKNKRRVNLRLILSAFALQVFIAFFALYLPFGKRALGALSASFQSVIDYSNEGINFLFGELAADTFGFIFVIRVLPVIIFFSALISVLYYLKIMPFIVGVLGGLVSRILGTSKVESLSAVANIFFDQSQSPLVVKPYLKTLSKAEFFSVMAVGLASVSGAILAGYAVLGVNLDYLITASFMAAPGGLLMANILFPKDPAEKDVSVVSEGKSENKAKVSNVIEAAANGAVEGLTLAAGIGATLLAFIAIIALLNGMFEGVGEIFGVKGLSFDQLLGWAFSPLMWCLGIPWEEAVSTGNLIGKKLILNEFVAFVDLIGVQETLSPHSVAVVTIALCGFANFSSLAILLGGLGALVPSRRSEIAKLGLHAVAAGTLSNLMSAAIVSFLLLSPVL